jgi:glutaredoxin
MLDRLRGKAFGALRSSFGNRVAPIRWTKDVLLFVNEMAGKPLAPVEELEERREREQARRERVREARDRRHAELREQAGPKTAIAVEHAGASARSGANPRGAELAPVTVYIDDNSRRELERIRGVLEGRAIRFKELDVEHDEASKSWVRTTSGRHELPIVFVGDKAVGAYDELVQLDVSGELVRLVQGG